MSHISRRNIGYGFLITAICFATSAGKTSTVQNNNIELAALPSSLGSDVDRLRRDNTRLREEIKAYQEEIDRRNGRASGELKALSAELSEKVEDRFYSSLTRGLWLAGMLIVVATAGGFWKLSDIITERVKEKVDEREADFENLSSKVFESLAELKVRVIEEDKKLMILSGRANKLIEELSSYVAKQRTDFDRFNQETKERMLLRVVEFEQIGSDISFASQQSLQSKDESNDVNKYRNAGQGLSGDAIDPALSSQSESELTARIQRLKDQSCIAGDPADPPKARELSLTHERLGDVFIARGEFLNAMAQFKQAQEILLNLSSLEHKDRALKQDLYMSLQKIGGFMVVYGDLRDSLAAYSGSRLIAQSLVDDNSADCLLQRELSVSHNNIGDVLVGTSKIANCPI
jgi:hypothetical protein